MITKGSMLSFVFPLCVFQLCWLCSFVTTTIAAEDLLQGAVLSSRGSSVTVTVNQDKALQPVIKRVETGETKQAPIFKLQIYDEGHFQHSSVILNASMFSTFNNKPNSCLCSSYSFLCLFTCQREHMEFSVLPHSTMYLAGMNKLLYQMCMTHLLIISAPKRPKKGSFEQEATVAFVITLNKPNQSFKKQSKTKKIPLNTKRKLLSAPPLITRSHHSRFGRFFMLDALYGFCVSSCKN